ncbi:MAG TPA: Fic family protein [Acidobacteriaceae bacterium]|jgi:Fic family protein
MTTLLHFIRESNRIEAITREPTDEEVQAHASLLEKQHIEIEDLETFVAAVAPGNVLRAKRGLDVRVGGHLPPPGGTQIINMLSDVLSFQHASTPFAVHCNFERLRPFTDGNGRSGRALWLWMMKRQSRYEYALKLGFLHAWYYQTLENDQ